jgi:Tol biopolymer transport system component
VESLTHGGDSFAPAVSPDGALLAYTVSGIGERQVWVRDLVSDTHWPVTSGACSNDSPAWDRDGRSLVFASDCDRGLGLPALYRIKVR